jgi:hypothetical protein
MKFDSPDDIPAEWGNPNPEKPRWIPTRYVPWTSWLAGAQQWGLSSMRQGESSGTITHEIVHTFGLPDNNNNPYVTPYHRVGTGPWDILDRGSFNGPGGPHKRWLVPVMQGGAMEAGMTLRTKLSEDWYTENDVHRVTRSGLAASGAQVLRLRARTADEKAGELTTGLKLDLDGAAPVDKTPACDTNTDPLCAGPGWQWYSVETVQRIGTDSMTPDTGVLISKNKDRQTNGCGYSCFGWVIDAHPEDMNMVDFHRPKSGTPVMRTIGDYRQLNDALFHAGTNSGSKTEFRDTPNRLHFYVLDKITDATGVVSYDVGIRHLDDAGPHARGVSIAQPSLAKSAAGLSTCTFTVRNTGSVVPVTAPAAPLDDPNLSNANDIYRLKAAGGDVHLVNEFAAIKAGETKSIPVYFKGDGLVSLTATSESDPSKTATAACSSADEDGTVGGSVPATLSLTLGTPASFGAFRPGTTATYTAVQSANVVSTAGDAALTVSDPSTTAPGHLVNGSFSLAEPLRAGGSVLPATVKTYSAPVSNDAAQIEFTQLVKLNDPLRTGAYAKTLTYTLSTTQP